MTTTRDGKFGTVHRPDWNGVREPARTRTSSTLYFGRHEGITLAVAAFNDPAWFHWALRAGAFLDQGGPALQQGAEEIWVKARHIRLREEQPEKWRAAYSYVGHKNRKFVDVWTVPVGEPQESADVKLVLDLGHVCAFEADKKGNQLLVKAIKRIVFGKGTRVTDEMIEQFFSDLNNFELDDTVVQVAAE